LSVVIASTPRSGNTWLRLLLAEALAFDQLALHHPAELSGGVLPQDAVVQMHWPPEPEFVAVIDTPDAVVLTLLRHPLDILVSILQFAQFSPLTSLWLQGDGGDEESLAGAEPNDVAVVDYARSERFRRLLAISHEWKHGGITIRYEELVRDPVGSLEGILSKMGADTDRVEDAAANNTFTRLHDIDPTHHPRGTPGGWRRLLTAATAEKVIDSLDDTYLDPYRSELAADVSLDGSEATRRWRGELRKIDRSPMLDVPTRIASLAAHLRERHDGRAGYRTRTVDRSVMGAVRTSRSGESTRPRPGVFEGGP